MKQQTFISMIEKDGKMIDFERWSYKRLSTVIRNVKELYSPDRWMYPIFKESLDKGDRIAIYETPNGYDDYNLVHVIPLNS